MTLRTRLDRLESKHGAHRDDPCTCAIPLVERLLGENEPEPEPDARSHCAKCGGLLPLVRVVEVVLPPLEASDANDSEPD
jgi:hypothetical protein